jgi:hypothetical protein
VFTEPDGGLADADADADADGVGAGGVGLGRVSRKASAAARTVSVWPVGSCTTAGTAFPTGTDNRAASRAP